MIKLGSSGPKVLWLQKVLNKCGSNLTEDGQFGPLTNVALKLYQQRHGMTPDGVVGPATEAALKRDDSDVGNPVMPSPKPWPLQRVPISGTTVKGVDISGWQPYMNWDDAIAKDVKFAYIKACEHLYQDKSFALHWKEAKQKGIIRGAYCYFHPGEDPIEQGKFFVKTVGKLDSNDLPLMVDWETTDNLPSEKDLASTAEFCKVLEDSMGVPPLIYTGPYFFDALKVVDDTWSKYPLWIAHYGTNAPLVPYPWKKWTIWQTTDQFQISGVGGVDGDIFNGTLDDLARLTVGGKPLQA